jgi:hypothetical protein
MTDIVEQLRLIASGESLRLHDCKEAADEVEKLQRRLLKLEADVKYVEGENKRFHAALRKILFEANTLQAAAEISRVALEGKR